jgi:hypothetical protein
MLRLLTALLLLPPFCSAGCLPFQDAPKHVGDTTCIKGKVIKVATSQRSGTHFLNFCQDYRTCPFTVVVFARDLGNVGDVRSLEGKDIEVYGKINEYQGAAEIILSSFKQLRGEARKLPPVPKHYDVSTRGNYSAGKFKSAKSSSAKKQRRNRRTTDDTAGEADTGPPEDD